MKVDFQARTTMAAADIFAALGEKELGYKWDGVIG